MVKKAFTMSAARQGKDIRTKSGRKVEILSTRALNGDYPVVAKVGRSIIGYNTNGKIEPDSDDNKDLCVYEPEAVKVAKRGWVNIYSNGKPGKSIHDTKAAAISAARESTGEVVAQAKMTWKQ